MIGFFRIRTIWLAVAFVDTKATANSATTTRMACAQASSFPVKTVRNWDVSNGFEEALFPLQSNLLVVSSLALVFSIRPLFFPRFRFPCSKRYHVSKAQYAIELAQPYHSQGYIGISGIVVHHQDPLFDMLRTLISYQARRSRTFTTQSM